MSFVRTGFIFAAALSAIAFTGNKLRAQEELLFSSI